MNKRTNSHSYKLYLLLIPLLLCSCAASVRTVKNQKYKLDAINQVAILPFSCSDPALGINLADSLGTELLGMGINLIERTQIEAIMREQKFELTGAVTPKEAIEIGRIAGVDALMVGSVTPFLGSSLVWGGAGQVMTANVRLIDTETGQVIVSTNYKNGEINATFQRFNKTVQKIANSISVALGL